MKKLYLTVLYKTKFSDSQTLRSFANLNFGKNRNNFFVIWDNSPESEATLPELQNFLHTENVDYVHTPENTSLSKVYNTCLKKYSDFDFLMIFDQDSKINRSDFDVYLEKAVSENPDVNIFLPQIYSSGKLYSPGRFWIFKGSHYKNLSVGIHKDKLYTAIMSGTCARISFLKENKIAFNEELSLYGIDTCFFTDVRKIDSRFYVLDEKLGHDLSENHLTGEEKKKRMRIYLEWIFVINKGSYFRTFIVCLYKTYLKLRGKI